MTVDDHGMLAGFPVASSDLDRTGYLEPSELDRAEVMAREQCCDLISRPSLIGRVTYESFFGAWPNRDGPMAEKINTMDKVVVSTTLGASEWANTSVIAGNVEDEVSELKASGDGPILLAGSCTLAQTLLATGLVDELHLQVFPLVLGSGRRLFADAPDVIRLEQVEARPFSTGVVAQTYRVG